MPKNLETTASSSSPEKRAYFPATRVKYEHCAVHNGTAARPTSTDVGTNVPQEGYLIQKEKDFEIH